MPKWFLPAAIVCALMFAATPIVIAYAPFESTMGLVFKIFFYHMPSAWMFLLGGIVCGVASVRYLISSDARHDRTAWAAAELTVLFGLLTLVTGPLWARKAWGTWWVWDVRVTASLVSWMIAVAYLLLRRYGGPGSEKLAAGVGIFGAANIPFVYYSVNWWRTIHPKTTVVPTLGPGMRGTFWFCVLAFMLLMVLIVAARVRLEEQRARLDDLFLELED